MLKTLWFQLHWLLGITAGIVLAVVGVTGGMLSFEHELKAWINPGVMTVTPQASAPLSPSEIIKRVQAELPERRITAVTVSTDPEESARVVFASSSRRGETRYVNPYTAELLGQPQGEEFFRLTMQIHRWLAAGDTGKAIVGASTVALIVLCLSGLYLRWPRRALNWRAWLALDIRHKGRSFLWNLHAVAGTWALLLYLLASLTGLYWSYEWYRDALFTLSGAPRPTQAARPPQTPAAQSPEGRQGEGQQAGARQADARQAAGARRERPQRERPAQPMDMGIAWNAFLREVPEYSTVTFRLPERPSQPVQVTYLDADPAHERASNRLTLDAQNGVVKSHERYDDKPAGAKLMSSIFVLHSGGFFGLPGLVAMMIASLGMPLFAITGWMLYLDRRRKKKALRTEKAATSIAPATASAGEWLIGFASQTGFAERLAWQTAGMLRSGGLPVTVQPLSRIDHSMLARFNHALFVVSTFGEGEPPDHARSFAKLMRQSASLKDLRFGLLALGSRQYETFCGFGRSLDQWLRTHGAQALFDRVEVDNEDPNALHRWQSSLNTVTGNSSTEEWAAAPHEAWRLTERRLLNPGSCGEPAFHLVLEPPQPSQPSQSHWQAGDLVDIRLPRPDGAAVDPADRQYSIASIPEDGAVHLLVRQTRHEGRLGLTSGWLTEQVQLDGEISLRIHSNPNFHAPEDERPLILIGNGTGIAGLRSHLKARARKMQQRNWLVFGERNIAHDLHFREDIDAWREQKVLERVDLVFSRDQPERVYVQDRLRASADTVRAWIADGAVILVCGSLEGMAPGVDAALKDILGDETMEKLIDDGRYRRDVY